MVIYAFQLDQLKKETESKIKFTEKLGKISFDIIDLLRKEKKLKSNIVFVWEMSLLFHNYPTV